MGVVIGVSSALGGAIVIFVFIAIYIRMKRRNRLRSRMSGKPAAEPPNGPMFQRSNTGLLKRGNSGLSRSMSGIQRANSSVKVPGVVRMGSMKVAQPAMTGGGTS